MLNRNSSDFYLKSLDGLCVLFSVDVAHHINGCLYQLSCVPIDNIFVDYTFMRKYLCECIITGRHRSGGGEPSKILVPDGSCS